MESSTSPTHLSLDTIRSRLVRPQDEGLPYILNSPLFNLLIRKIQGLAIINQSSPSTPAAVTSSPRSQTALATRSKTPNSTKRRTIPQGLDSTTLSARIWTSSGPTLTPSTRTAVAESSAAPWRTWWPRRTSQGLALIIITLNSAAKIDVVALILSQ